jgi:DNA-binding NarL/FixJ family response regulator
VDDDRPRLDTSDLAKLRDAVRGAQGPRDSAPRAEVLAVHAATPPNTNLTVDLAATEELGMPLLVVRVPIGPRPSPVLRRLTAREFEVAGLVAAGYANKEIAARLGIQTSTVKEHVHRILEKTGLPSRSAVARAYVGGGDPDGDPGVDSGG